MSRQDPLIATNITDFIRARGGNFIGAMLSAAGCFDSPFLDQLWNEDADGWDVFFDAWCDLNKLQDCLMRRDLQRYSVPSEITFSTLKALTMVMSDMIAQTAMLQNQSGVRTLLHLGLGNQVIALLSDSDLDCSLLVEFFAEIAVALGDSTNVVRALQSMAKMNPSKHDVMDAVCTYANGRLLRLTEVNSQECVA